MFLMVAGDNMCGILGGNNSKWDYENGIQSLYHRGPDGCRVENLGDIVMAFSRLAIIDLSDNGMQPMTSLDGNVTIIYNGEIYDYKALENELKRKYKFHSTSDTEVILNAYLEYGDKFIEKIDGMFAIAIYDKRTMQLKLYRDRTGIKPLYYYCRGNQFAFASELKAIIKACTDLRWETDYTALYDYLFYGYIPDPKTVYKDCYKLPPAHALIYDLKDNKILEIKKYWKLHVNTAKGRYRKASVLCDDLRDILSRSIEQQLIADVPVGCFLSGGVDSSIIAYESNKINPDIHTYNIGFVEKEYDESVYADLMADRYHMNHKKMILSYRDVDNIKGKLKLWYDEPFADTSAYPTYIVSNLAKKDVTVIVSGDGGDELFGGYRRYSAWAETLNDKPIDNELISKIGRILKINSFIPDSYMKRFVNTSLDNYFPYILLTDEKTVEDYRVKWNIGKDYDPYWYFKKYYKKELPIMTRVRYLDYKTYLPADVLTKMDRVSMANSLEVRVPFLGKEVIEFAFSLSEEECCSPQELKKILKEAYEDVVPKELLYRKKMGFAIPPVYMGGKGVPLTCKILRQEFRDIQ